MTRTAIAAVVGVAVALVVPSFAQTQQSSPPPATGLILGQVLDGSSDRPMAGVVVRLNTGTGVPAPPPSGPPVSRPQPRGAIADANGRFVFRDLPAGRYGFSISTASGDLIGGYGMRRPGGSSQPFELAEGQRVGDLTLRAWKYGAVAGTVIDQDGEPVVETRVTLMRVEVVAGHRRYRAGPTTMTDDRGMYRISRVEPGEYTAYLPYTQVTVPVEVQAAYDSVASRGQAARLEYERTYGLDTASGVNGSGPRIGDHLLVRASNLYGVAGQMGASFMSPPPDSNGRVLVYPMTFYPGVSALSEATTFTVASAQERGGTDLRVRLVPSVQISGRVLGVEGPAQMITVRLVAQTAADSATEAGLETATTITNSAGEFTFLGVPSGSYALKVTRVPNTTRPATMTSVTVGTTTTMSFVDDANLPPLPIPDTPTETQSMPLVVGSQDIRNLTVQLERGPRISGRVAYDGTAPPLTTDQLIRITIALDPVDGRTFPGATGKGLFDASGQFKTLGLVPGRYVVRLGGSLGPWQLGSVSIGGNGTPDQSIAITTRDITDVVITLTDHAGSLSGSVRDARSGSVDPNAIVLVFPANPSLWMDGSASPRRMRSSRASARGTFEIDNLFPGEYVVIAIDDRLAADWQDPRRLESLARSGTHVTFSAAEKKTVDLTTAVIR